MGLKKHIALLSSVIIGFSSIDAMACAMHVDPHGGVEDIYAWQQGVVPYTGDDVIIADYTIRDHGCGWFSCAYMLVKMGKMNPYNGDTPLNLLHMAQDNGYIGPEWEFDYTMIDHLYEGVHWAWRETLPYEMGRQACINRVKEIYDAGYYCVVLLKDPNFLGHFIFIDGFTQEGNMIIGDSAHYGKYWSDFYDNPTPKSGEASGQNRILYQVLVFSCDGKPCNLQPSIYAQPVVEQVVQEVIEETAEAEDTKDATEELTNSDDEIKESESVLDSSLDESNQGNVIEETTSTSKDTQNYVKSYDDLTEPGIEVKENKQAQGTNGAVNQKGNQTQVLNSDSIIDLDEVEDETKSEQELLIEQLEAEGKIGEYIDLSQYGKDDEDLIEESDGWIVYEQDGWLIEEKVSTDKEVPNTKSVNNEVTDKEQNVVIRSTRSDIRLK